MSEGHRADVPKTDRELLLQVAGSLEHIREKIEGENGICDILRIHTDRLNSLENWRWYILGGVTLATFILIALEQYLNAMVR